MSALPDSDRVRELLGREPQGHYDIVVRDAEGDPVVLKNSPFMNDGTPMPTRYWLISPDEIRRVGTLEAAGGVNAAESSIDPELIADAHARYAAERDADIPLDHVGPRPYGGVAGTRVGVKCLHAHWAWHLAGGDDPVGRWVERQLADDANEPAVSDPNISGLVTDAAVVIEVRDDSLHVALPDAPSANHEPAVIPWGPVNLTVAWLADHDPPRPEDLTNALGTIDDHLDDVERLHPSIRAVPIFTLRGPSITALARLELGSSVTTPQVQLDRPAGEEVFRLVATESLAQRAQNPGLPSDAVETVVATCVIVVAVMRRFKLDTICLDTSDPSTGAARPAI